MFTLEKEKLAKATADKDAELTSLRTKLESTASASAAQVGQLEHDLNVARSEVEQATQSLSAKTTSLCELETKHASTVAELEQLNLENSKAKATHESVVNELAEKKEQLASKQASLDKLQADIANSSAEVIA